MARQPIDRFLAKVAVQPNGCWLWQGCVLPSGYGQFSEQSRPRSAHRWSYQHYIGPIPDGLVVDHRCHNLADCDGGAACQHRRCVNPEHLEAVPQRTNIHRGQTGTNQKLKATCSQGHPRTEANVQVIAGRRPGGTRRGGCRICMNARTRAWRQRQKAGAPNA